MKFAKPWAISSARQTWDTFVAGSTINCLTAINTYFRGHVKKAKGLCQKGRKHCRAY